MAEPAHLIDVDLHVVSRRSMATLHAALPGAQPRGVERPTWIHLAAATTAKARTVDRKIRELVALIDALPPAAKRCWNDARVRTFDVGIQAGPADREPIRRPFELGLEPDTLREVIRVKGRIQITVYPPMQAAAPPARRVNVRSGIA